MIGKILRTLVVLLMIGALGGYLYIQMFHQPPSYHYGEIRVEAYDVYALTSGIIEEIKVAEGDSVTEGSEVMVLDSETAEVAMERAAQAKEIAEANLAKAETPSDLESIQIQQLTIERLSAESESLAQSAAALSKAYSAALVQISTLKAIRDNHQQSYDDQLMLFEDGVVTMQSVDAASLQLTQSQGAVDQAELEAGRVLTEKKALDYQAAALELQMLAAEEQLIRLNRGADQEDLTIAELNIGAADIERSMAELQLEDYRVTAYTAGKVEEVYYKIGEFVNAGAPVMTLRDEQVLETRIYVSENDLRNLAVGELLIFHTVSVPEILVEGEIINIAGEAMFTPVNIVTADDRDKLVYEVTVALTYADELQSGMLLATELKGRE